jgi:peptide-methionine (R)-S-oxide reductase
MVFPSCAQDSSNSKMESNEKIVKSEEEWKQLLTAEEYEVLRNNATELAFTGEYFGHKEKGVYTCAGCGNELFSSKTKYNSGSGWPSFYKPINDGAVGTQVENSLGIPRTEIHCNKCDGHLGHVFEDGPKPTGLRYCVNSISLDFKKK